MTWRWRAWVRRLRLGFFSLAGAAATAVSCAGGSVRLRFISHGTPGMRRPAAKHDVAAQLPYFAWKHGVERAADGLVGLHDAPPARMVGQGAIDRPMRLHGGRDGQGVLRASVCPGPVADSSRGLRRRSRNRAAGPGRAAKCDDRPRRQVRVRADLLDDRCRLRPQAQHLLLPLSMSVCRRLRGHRCAGSRTSTGACGGLPRRSAAVPSSRACRGSVAAARADPTIHPRLEPQRAPAVDARRPASRPARAASTPRHWR